MGIGRNGRNVTIYGTPNFNIDDNSLFCNGFLATDHLHANVTILGTQHRNLYIAVCARSHACALAPARAREVQGTGGKKIRVKFISRPKDIFAVFEEARTRYVMVRWSRHPSSPLPPPNY